MDIKIISVESEKATPYGQFGVSIPIKINGSPDAFWINSFVAEWQNFDGGKQHPSSVPKVQGNQITIEGTTPELLKEIHLKSLNEVIKITNQKYNKQKEEDDESHKRSLENKKKADENFKNAKNELRDMNKDLDKYL